MDPEGSWSMFPPQPLGGRRCSFCIQGRPEKQHPHTKRWMCRTMESLTGGMNGTTNCSYTGSKSHLDECNHTIRTGQSSCQAAAGECCHGWRLLCVCLASVQTLMLRHHYKAASSGSRGLGKVDENMWDISNHRIVFICRATPALSELIHSSSLINH